MGCAVSEFLLSCFGPPDRSYLAPAGRSVDAPECSYSGVQLPWGTKPDPSSYGINLMTSVASGTTVFVHHVDVTDQISVCIRDARF